MYTGLGNCSPSLLTCKELCKHAGLASYAPKILYADVSSTFNALLDHPWCGSVVMPRQFLPARLLMTPSRLSAAKKQPLGGEAEAGSTCRVG